MARRRIVAGILTASLAILPLAAVPSDATEPKPIPIGMEQQPSVSSDTNTIIVTFDHNQDDPAHAARDVVEQTGATVAKVSPITDKTVTVTLDPAVTPAETARIGDEVEAEDGVRAAESAAAFATGATSDTDYSFLWNLTPGLGSSFSVNAEAAWPTTTGVGLVVGVIDTGITAHSDLSGSSTAIVGGNLVAGYDFISNSIAAGDGNGRDNNPSDAGDWCTGDNSSWHGTHVTGTIVALRNNSKGIVGVAPGAKVQPLRALGKCGGAESDIIAAILWGAGLPVSGLPTNATPAKVLNLSLGSANPCSYAMQSAINSAVGRGVTVVVAAGNAGQPVVTAMPANCNNVISVAATGPTGAIAGYSNYGTATKGITIAAPGGTQSCSSTNSTNCIASTWNRGTTTVGTEGYAGMVGTSMAAPHVAAAAAMLKAVKPSLTPSQITALLTGNTTALTACGVKCGSGLLNVAKAVAVAAGPAGTLTKTRSPDISGTYRYGRTIKAHVGRWSPSGNSYRYQWLKSGAKISGATKSSYKLPKSMKHKHISVKITVSRAGYTTTTATSSKHKVH